MDLSRDVVRGYCKRHGLNGLASKLVLNQDKDEKFIREITHVYCLICGFKLEQNQGRGAKKKYCSIDCCYVRDRFFKDEEAAEILDKIMKRKKVDFVVRRLIAFLFKN